MDLRRLGSECLHRSPAVFLSPSYPAAPGRLHGVLLFQRSQTQSPTPPRPPSPSFELGLSSFPPLPGAAGHLKTEDLFENRLSGLLTGSSKERVSYPKPDAHSPLASRSLHVCFFHMRKRFMRISDCRGHIGFEWYGQRWSPALVCCTDTHSPRNSGCIFILAIHDLLLFYKSAE